MLKLLHLTAALSTAVISILPWFQNPVVAQVLNKEPKIEFTSIQIQKNLASGYIANLSNQNVDVERINVVIGNHSLQIVADFYLKPGEAVRFKNARVAGPATDANGYIRDIVNWLDEKHYGYSSNFLMCKYITGSGAEGSYSLDREKRCTSK